MTAVWKRNQPVSDHGRTVDNYVTIDPALPVRLHIAGASNPIIGWQERAEVTHVIYTDPGVALRVLDRLFIHDVEYRILSKKAPSKPEHHLAWAAVEQQQSSGLS